MYHAGPKPNLFTNALLIAACILTCHLQTAFPAAAKRPKPPIPDVTLAAIQNQTPRLDSAGSIMDVHDGCLEFFQGTFYLYGTKYAETDGFTTANRYVCYSSPDLNTWHFQGELLSESTPAGVYYRPYVKYNPNTKLYVLWYNWYPTLWDGQYGVATSPTPQGPFTIQNGNVKVANEKPGDHGLLIDDDGQAYLIYTSIAKNHAVSVEKLAPDYLSSTLENSGIIAENCEAAAMIKTNNLYYAFFDNCCCFCPQGTGARVYTADSPLGPYTLRGNINRHDNDQVIIPAQQTHIAAIPTPSGKKFIWMGDLWGSRPDNIKGHDLQYWSSPLIFNEDGSIQKLKNDPSWTIQLLKP